MDDAFITCALHEVRRGLAFAMVDANLDRRPETLTQAVARRVKARMKELEVILRRLIVLIALSLTLAPVKPRNASKPDGEGEPVLTKSSALYSIALTGQVDFYSLDGPGFPDAASHASGPVWTAPLLRRFAALARILRNPERYARRVARTLDRHRKAGEPRPACLPMTTTARLHPELGLVAAGLPQLLVAAFDRWIGTG